MSEIAGARLAFTIDADNFGRLSNVFGRMPEATERALKRALKKLSTWLRRRALQAAAKSAGVAQKFFAQAMRYYVVIERTNGVPSGVSVWVGTNPVEQHRLGTVTWTRQMRGARRSGSKPRTWPGSWSWGAAGKTGPAIMERTGTARMPIARVPDEAIHEPILAALGEVQDEARERFGRLLTQELNYALREESR